MSEFLRLISVDRVLRTLALTVKTLVTSEAVNTSEALSRITAGDIYSPEDLPSFVRSTMDGYAVRASDTYGANEGQPVYLNVIGEIPMGQIVTKAIKKGEALKVHTGGMIPLGADSVLMIENTQQTTGSLIEVIKSVALEENIIKIGSDVRAGDLVIPAGHLLRPQDIGGLMALGKTRIDVFARPRVNIISTGDEIVPPEKLPLNGQVRDINTYTLSSLAIQSGAIPASYGIVADDFEALSRTAKMGFDDGEVLLISAGSSISTRDITAKVIASLGNSEMMIHGVSIKPGKPTIIAVVNGKPVFGVPGNPVSAMVVFDLFIRPAIYRVGGCRKIPVSPTISARITHNIPSTPGREDYIPVELKWEGDGYSANPIFGESNMISTMIKANGIAKIPRDKHGLAAGEVVDVRLFQ